MNPQQHHELAFWNSLVQQHGPNFRAYRLGGYEWRTRNFAPYWESQQGLGLEGWIGMPKCARRM